LLIDRGKGTYTFPTAATRNTCCVPPRRPGGFPDQAARLIGRNYAQWREVVLWAAGVMARLKKMIHVASECGRRDLPV